MWALLSTMLLGILVGIFWSESQWKTRFLLSASPEVSLVPIPERPGAAPGTCSTPEMCVFEYWNVSAPFLRKAPNASKTELVVFAATHGKWDGVSLRAVGRAMARVAALALLAVSARVAVGLALRHIAFKKLFGSLWSAMDGWQAVEFQTRFVTSADYSQMDALLTSHLEILETLQVDIQHRLAASATAAAAAPAPPAGSRVWWRALHVLVRELRLTIHELRLRLEQRVASTPTEVLEGAAMPATPPPPPPRLHLRRHVGRALRRAPRRRAGRPLASAGVAEQRAPEATTAEPVAGTSTAAVASPRGKKTKTSRRTLSARRRAKEGTKDGSSACEDEKEKEMAVEAAEMKENVPPPSRVPPNGVRSPPKAEEETTPPRATRNLKTPSIFLDPSKALLAGQGRQSLKEMAPEAEACVE